MKRQLGDESSATLPPAKRAHLNPKVWTILCVAGESEIRGDAEYFICKTTLHEDEKILLDLITSKKKPWKASNYRFWDGAQHVMVSYLLHARCNNAFTSHDGDPHVEVDPEFFEKLPTDDSALVTQLKAVYSKYCDERAKTFDYILSDPNFHPYDADFVWEKMSAYFAHVKESAVNFKDIDCLVERLDVERFEAFATEK